MDYPLSLVKAPQSIVSFIKHAMADNPQERFLNVDDMLDEINRLTSLSNYPKYQPLTEQEIDKRKKRAATTECS